jgi:hypothetical protein
MSRQEKSKQAKGGLTLRRRAVALFAAMLLATTTLASVALARLPSPGGAWQEADEVQIVLGASGFTPAGVTHAAGNFALAVENQDAAGEYVLRLTSADGTLLNEVRVQKGTAVWTVDLAAGSYALTVADHPDWVCQITVQ